MIWPFFIFDLSILKHWYFLTLFSELFITKTKADSRAQSIICKFLWKNSAKKKWKKNGSRQLRHKVWPLQAGVPGDLRQMFSDMPHA